MTQGRGSRRAEAVPENSGSVGTTPFNKSLFHPTEGLYLPNEATLAGRIRNITMDLIDQAVQVEGGMTTASGPYRISSQTEISTPYYIKTVDVVNKQLYLVKADGAALGWVDADKVKAYGIVPRK